MQQRVESFMTCVGNTNQQISVLSLEGLLRSSAQVCSPRHQIQVTVVANNWCRVLHINKIDHNNYLSFIECWELNYMFN